MATAPTAEPTTGNERVRLGDNLPPVDILDHAQREVDAYLDTVDAQATDLLDEAERVTAVDDATAPAALETAKKLHSLGQAIEERRKEIGKPYFEANKLVKASADVVIFKLDRQRLRIGGLLDVHHKELQRRQREAEEAAERALREEAERRAAENPGEPEPAYVPPPPRAKSVGVKSATGARTVSQTVKEVVVTDPYALPKHILTHEKVLDALKSVITAELRANPDLKRRGFEVQESTRTVVR